MTGSVLWLTMALGFTLIVGPLTFIVSQTGNTDSGDLYVLVDTGDAVLTPPQLAAFGARGIGPERGRFAIMVHAPPPARKLLLHEGYFLVPASAVAQLCNPNSFSIAPSPNES